MDNGTEFRARVLAGWSEQRRVRLQHIEPGKPVQNGYIESFTGRLREEWLELDANWFLSLADSQRKIEVWRRDYNEERPHSWLGYMPSHQSALTSQVGTVQ